MYDEMEKQHADAQIESELQRERFVKAKQKALLDDFSAKNNQYKDVLNNPA